MSNKPKQGQKLTIDFMGRERACEVLHVGERDMVVVLEDGRNVSVPLGSGVPLRRETAGEVAMEREKGS